MDRQIGHLFTFFKEEPQHYHTPDCASSAASYGAPMFRLISLLALMPNLALAELTLRPAMFSYDATFDTCLIDPETVSARDCADRLHDAYVLNRAVVWAMQDCDDTPLSICAAPFEDQGLTAISARIADGVGCDRSGLAALESGAPLTPEHCISIISDILRDEGVVPFIQETSCHALDRGVSDCADLILLHTQMWEDAVLDLAPNDPLIVDLLGRIAQACADDITGETSLDPYLSGANCVSDNSSLLWADLAIQNEQDN
jgi:hypothetical protein